MVGHRIGVAVVLLMVAAVLVAAPGPAGAGFEGDGDLDLVFANGGSNGALLPAELGSPAADAAGDLSPTADPSNRIADLEADLIVGGSMQARFVNVEAPALQSGEKGAVRLKAYPTSSTEATPGGHPFVLIGWHSDTLDLAGIRPFDLGAANYGGPHPRTKDNPLRDLLLTPDTCVVDGLDAADITGYDQWRAYRTVDPIDPTLGELDDPMRINLFFISQMDDTEPRGSLVIITGTWDDTTTNGTPDLGETTCTSLTLTSIAHEAPSAPWPTEIVFGFVPAWGAENVQDDADALAAALSDALGIGVQVLVTTDSTTLAVAMGNDTADFGAYGPVGFVLADQAFPGEFELVAQSVRFGSPTYHGQWFTDDPLICAEAPVPGAFENLDPGTGGYLATGVPTLLGPTEVRALQVGYNADGTRMEAISEGHACEAPLSSVIGKTIAFTTETSTSGYIHPTVQLRNAGIAGSEYTAVFAGGHDAAVQAVYNGDADIGVAFDDARRTLHWEHPDVGEVVIVFTITPDIANDVMAARAALPESLKEAFFQAMSAYLATPAGEAVMDNLCGWTDADRPDPTSLQAIIDMLSLFP